MSLSPAPSWASRVMDAIDGLLPEGARRIVSGRMILMILVVGAILGTVFGVNKFRAGGGPQGGMTPATVSTVRAGLKDWQPELKAVGSLHAVAGADLAAEVSGIVVKIGFTPGEDVQKGRLMVQLRDDADRADLAARQAEAALAARTFERNRTLLAQGVIARAAYDNAEATLNAAKAQVNAEAALVAKKAIRAPFPGRVGIRKVDVGQYVEAGEALVTLQQLDPIHVDFPVPQQEAAALAPGQAVTLATDAAPGKVFAGKIVALDAVADPETRNILVRATVENPEKRLLPGMFATVTVAAGAEAKKLTLPQTALVFNPYGNSVFVVKPGQAGAPPTVEERFVTTGETRGDDIVVVSGLKAGEQVVSAGQIKLRNGSPVTIDKGAGPKAD